MFHESQKTSTTRKRWTLKKFSLDALKQLFHSVNALITQAIPFSVFTAGRILPETKNDIKKSHHVQFICKSSISPTSRRAYKAVCGVCDKGTSKTKIDDHTKENLKRTKCNSDVISAGQPREMILMGTNTSYQDLSKEEQVIGVGFCLRSSEAMKHWKDYYGTLYKASTYITWVKLCEYLIQCSLFEKKNYNVLPIHFIRL